MSKAWPVAVAIVALLVSGCMESGSQPEGAPASGENIVTSPGDYSYLQNGSSGAHRHDYWGGEDRLTVQESSVSEVGPGVAGGSSVEIHTFRPDSGHVVPQGASKVEVTLTWQDATGDMYSRPELWVKTAADAQASKVKAIASGEMVVLESTNEKNDLPHQLLSAWEFQFRLSSPSAPQPFLRFKGGLSLKVEAVRGLEIPLYPAHPDAWKGQSELALLDVSGRVLYAHDPLDGGCNGFYCSQIIDPADGRIVPHNATSVKLVFEVTGPLQVTRIGLAYHSAESREFTRLVPASETGRTRTFEIPVGDFGDGPYASQSQWEFLVVIDGPVKDGLTSEEYSLKATVLR